MSSCFHVETRYCFSFFLGDEGINGWLSWGCFHVETEFAVQLDMRVCVRSEKKRGLCSPGCGVVFEKSIVEALMRGGVPVLSRMRLNPRLLREVLRRSTAGRPSPPEERDSFPMKILPRRVVPVVRMIFCVEIMPLFSV